MANTKVAINMWNLCQSYYQIYFTGCKIGKALLFIVYFFFNVLGRWGKNISYLKEPIVIDQIQNYVQEVFSYNLS